MFKVVSLFSKLKLWMLGSIGIRVKLKTNGERSVNKFMKVIV